MLFLHAFEVEQVRLNGIKKSLQNKVKQVKMKVNG